MSCMSKSVKMYAGGHFMKFISKTELANHLEISRATLYRRSEKYNVDIEHLNDKGISDDDMDLLTQDSSSKERSDVNEVERLRAEVKRLTADNEDTHVKHERLSQEYDELNKQYRDKVTEYADALVRLNDQQQKLTLDVQDKLHAIEEPKKGFWARLFG